MKKLTHSLTHSLTCLLIAILMTGCFTEKKESKELPVEKITAESAIEKEAKTLTESYGLEQSKALALVRGLKREGLEVQDLNETLNYDAKESLTVGIADDTGAVVSYETIQPKMLENIEELNADNADYQNLTAEEKANLDVELKESCKEEIDNSLKTGILVSKVDEGIEEAIGYVIDKKVENEVKKAADYDAMIIQYQNGEITKEEIVAKMQAKYTEMLDNNEFVEMETRFNQKKKMRKLEREKREKFSVAGSYTMDELINNSMIYMNYINGFGGVRKGDIGWFDDPYAGVSNMINNAKWFIVPNLLNIGQTFVKSEMDHAFFIGRDFSELVDITLMEVHLTLHTKKGTGILKKILCGRP